MLSLLSPLFLRAADPITTRGDEVGQLLNQWAAEGKAAGLSAITYENRDGFHSPLNTALWPGLKLTYPPGTDPNTMEKGPANRVRQVPTVGNCSMAAPADKGGSLPRLYLMDQGGYAFLYQQYVHNNLFIYPEHQDHDIGSWGIGGWGDLYPANSPCLITSQGSSGTDQPFLQAVLSTIAAFPPETQRLLIDKNILMPTVQAILRRTSHLVKEEKDYLSGRAHPDVFDSAWLNEKEMVLMANRMAPGAIPPVALFEIAEETEFEENAHFFEAAKPLPWKLGTTPVSASRLYRGNSRRIQFVVSTGKSGDIQGRPVKVQWVVLQGNPEWISLETAREKPVIRLNVRWHPGLEEPASGIASHRVDLALFASNGVSISAPSILSISMLPNEMRFYDAEGRLSEIYYAAHNPSLGLPVTDTDRRWLALLRACTQSTGDLRSTLLERALESAERDFFKTALDELLVLHEQLVQVENQPEHADEATKALQALEQKIQQTLSATLPGNRKLTGRKTLATALDAIARFTDLFPGFQEELLKLASQSSKVSATGDIEREVRRLVNLGILVQRSGGSLVPLHSKDQRSESEEYYLKGLNLTLLTQVLYPDALERHPGTAWVDPRLTTPKQWRDVYRYDDQGKFLGWQRYHARRISDFDERGRWLPDGFAHPESAVAVEYVPDADLGLRWERKN
ncbi:MAG: hypothetical protein KDK99_05550 [Verrucomicrobiales bacterium]|nr:hypothetical protein [Verrucomicrobiales bacterium]